MQRIRLSFFIAGGLLLCCLLGVGRASYGQPQPAGGYPLRVVAVLARAPLPPGGLIPYRQGSRWGYADTTGRVVIAPVLLDEPKFFVEEWAEVNLAEVPLFSRPNAATASQARRNARAMKELQNTYGLLNARGEILLIHQHAGQVTLLRPDGSLGAGRASQHVGEPRLDAFQVTSPADGTAPRWVIGPVPPTVRNPDAAYRYAQAHVPLGAGRYAYGPATRFRLVQRVRHPSGSDRRAPSFTRRFLRRGPGYRGTLLADSATHLRLTNYRYEFIAPFHDHRARAQLRPPKRLALATQPRWTYLDPQGHELALPAAIGEATDFAGGAALVWTLRPSSSGPADHALGGIIDPQGRWLLRPTGTLSPPDQYGLLRFTERVGADSLTRFLTRQGQPAFVPNVFRHAGPFYNGRAWVEALDGRQGLLNRQGQWVTPLAYEVLGSVLARYNQLRTSPLYSHGDAWASRYTSSSFPNSQPADTAYMLARRAGKYGWVARRTGQEVVPARYDSVSYYLTAGVACAARGGQAYVLNARGRELVQATYRGDWYDYPGRPLHVYRPGAGTWSAIDTSGHARLPWLPGAGYLTPEGRAVVQEPNPDGPNLPGYQRPETPCTGVVDAAGHVVIPFAYGTRYSGWPASMHLDWMRYVYDPVLAISNLPDSNTPSGAYVVYVDGRHVQLLGAPDLRPFTPGSFYLLGVLASGWHVGSRLADSLSVLINPAGRQWAAPRGTTWQRALTSLPGANQDVPFARGAERLRVLEQRPGYGLQPGPAGYVTRGGRRLWAD